MKLCIRQIAFLLAACFLCNQANALFKADLPQITSILKQGSTTVNKLNEAKESLSKLEETKKSIGSNLNSYTKNFSKDQTIDEESTKEAANNTKTQVKGHLEGIMVAQNSINEALQTAQKQQQNLAAIIVETAEATIADNHENPSQIKEDLATDFDNIKEVGVQLATVVNDIFDVALKSLNQNAKNSHETLLALHKKIGSDKNLNQASKEALFAKNLTTKEQETSDDGIYIIETAQTQYNKEYKENFSDELNNYQRVITAYAEGHADKNTVIKAGEQFKLAVLNITMGLNKAVTDGYKHQAQTFQNELETITNNISEQITTENIIQQI